MKKTLSEKYSFLSLYKNLIIIVFVLSTVLSTIFLIYINHEVELENTQLLYLFLTYIFLLVSVVGVIKMINFLFELDRTKNNLEGKKIKYYENGQKSQEITYKDGERDGSFIRWNENGQKLQEVTYKGGERDGLQTEWYENGNKKFEENFRDGERDGLLTRWYENGKKNYEVNYKNHKRNGLWTSWYEDGQKKEETTFKDDKQISSKEWNEDGSVKE